MPESQKSPEAKIDSKAIDATQDKIDKFDGKADTFHYNQYLTSLVFHDTDALQKKIEKLKDPEKKKQAYEALHSALSLIVAEHASRAEGVRTMKSVTGIEAPIYGNSLAELNSRLDDIAEMIAIGCNASLTEAEKKEFEKGDRLPLELVKNGMAFIRTDALAQLEKYIAGKKPDKGINEHYLEFLTYPEDSRYIKAVIESLIEYHEDSGSIWLHDAHPFAIMAWAAHIKLPENFQFKLRKKGKHGGTQEYTLKELIDEESEHLLTKVKIKGGHEPVDDEFFLDFLNTRGIMDPNVKVGTNIKGESIFLRDVIKSVKSEEKIGNVEAVKLFRDFPGNPIIEGQIKPATRIVMTNPNTCGGVHTVDALLQSKGIPETEKDKYADDIFEKTLKSYMGISSNAPLVYRIENIGHAIELYVKNKQYFSHPNRKILQHMIDEIPGILQEIQRPGNKEMKGIGLQQFAHFYSALELLERQK